MTEKELKYIADIGKISIKGNEKEKIMKSVNEMISYFNKLEKLDVSGVEPMELITPEKNILREDVVGKSYDRDALLENAVNSKNGYYTVPQIVE